MACCYVWIPMPTCMRFEIWPCCTRWMLAPLTPYTIPAQAHHDLVRHQQHPRPVRPQSQPVDGQEEPSLPAWALSGQTALVTPPPECHGGTSGGSAWLFCRRPLMFLASLPRQRAFESSAAASELGQLLHTWMCHLVMWESSGLFSRYLCATGGGPIWCVHQASR